MRSQKPVELIALGGIAHAWVDDDAPAARIREQVRVFLEPVEGKLM